MTKIQQLKKQLKNTINKIREERRRLANREAIKGKEVNHNPRIQNGRPRISEEKLLEIEIDAYKRPLVDVALKHGVALKTLYNYGITRKELNRKIAENNLMDVLVRGDK